MWNIVTFPYLLTSSIDLSYFFLPTPGEAEPLFTTSADVEKTGEPAPADDGEETTEPPAPPVESKSPPSAAEGDDGEKTTEPPAPPVESKSPPPARPDKTGKVENCTRFRFPY